MKKLVILLFLFLGGVCLEGRIKDVYATDTESKSTIYFTETYVYTPTLEQENINGVTPTGSPPDKVNSNQNLPKAGECTSNLFMQFMGILLCTLSIIIKINRKKEINHENN